MSEFLNGTMFDLLFYPDIFKTQPKCLVPLSILEDNNYKVVDINSLILLAKA